MEKILRFVKDEEGATAVEYGILIAAIAAAVIVVVGNIGSKIESAFNKVSTLIT
jgi:pilus assembly protein Flp/PilA